jgi:uncharacterized protein YukE
MSKMSIDHSQLQARAKELAQTKNDIELLMQTAQKQILSLKSDGGFDTEVAGTDFQTAYDSWNNSAKKTIENLEVIGGYLRNVSSTFEQVDRDVTVKL